MKTDLSGVTTWLPIVCKGSSREMMTMETAKRISSVGLAWGLFLALSAGTAASLFAQGRPSRGTRPSAAKPEDEAKKESKDSQDDKKSKVTAIVGGDIITVTRETIRGGTILIEDGKITAIGNKVVVPEEAEKIDATGMTVTPGFVAMDVSRVGLEIVSGNGADQRDGLNPFDRNISLSLGVGITAGCVKVSSGSGRRSRRAEVEPLAEGESFPITRRFPGLDPDAVELQSAKPVEERDYGEFVALCKCCGLPILPTAPIETYKPQPISTQNNVVIKMSYGSLDGMLVAEDVLLDVGPGSLTGALNQLNWREQIASARQYLKDQAAHEKATADGKKQSPPKKPVSDEVLKLVQGEVALRIAAGAVTDIRDMIELSKELDYKLVIDGGAEAWVIPKELAEANVSVVYTPRDRRRPVFGEEDRSGTWIEAPRVFEEAGIPFALSTLSNSISLGGLAGRDLTSLPLEAAFAVRGGASERKALAAMTIVPATILGLQDRMGSLEVGKDADILLLNGSPLDYRTYVQTALVNGRISYQRDKDRVLPVYE